MPRSGAIRTTPMEISRGMPKPFWDTLLGYIRYWSKHRRTSGRCVQPWKHFVLCAGATPALEPFGRRTTGWEFYQTQHGIQLPKQEGFSLGYFQCQNPGETPESSRALPETTCCQAVMGGRPNVLYARSKASTHCHGSCRISWQCIRTNESITWHSNCSSTNLDQYE